ncbi:hypothetical protein WA026_012458 [Henosepilachna vigintioctopunctata]|uniref:Uncharacterized protein n=1 Tax=Henosepilachna vigintioctopunctata TaxID=420089 RepID=A0AAW1UYW6_9CUCU
MPVTESTNIMVYKMSKTACKCCNKSVENHLTVTWCIHWDVYGSACVRLSGSEARIINSKKSITWNCNKCEDISKDIASLRSVLKSLQAEIKELKDQSIP